MKYNAIGNSYEDTTLIHNKSIPITYVLDRSHDIGDLIGKYNERRNICQPLQYKVMSFVD